jgi:phosphoribosyl 1,2-cyclic phosphate phosphodiesterase
MDDKNQLFKNRITFLGTGTSQGVPVISCKCDVCKSIDIKDKRFRSSAFVEFNDGKFLIDCGPDFRTQMLNNNLTDLDAVLFTHEHRDHVAGLDDLRPLNFKYEKDIPLYCTAKVGRELKKTFNYAFSENKYPGAPSFELIYFDNETFKVDSVEIEPLPVKHGSWEVHGFKFGNLAYITDASEIPSSTKKKLHDLEILVLNALRLEKHHSHFTLDQALEIYRELKPKRMYLTHISHLLGKHNEVEKTLPKGVLLANDGLQIEFN